MAYTPSLSYGLALSISRPFILQGQWTHEHWLRVLLVTQTPSPWGHLSVKQNFDPPQQYHTLHKFNPVFLLKQSTSLMKRYIIHSYIWIRLRFQQCVQRLQIYIFHFSVRCTNMFKHYSTTNSLTCITMQFILRRILNDSVWGSFFTSQYWSAVLLTKIHFYQAMKNNINETHILWHFEGKHQYAIGIPWAFRKSGSGDFFSKQ